MSSQRYENVPCVLGNDFIVPACVHCFIHLTNVEVCFLELQFRDQSAESETFLYFYSFSA